jgi:hypothetical protein
MATQIKLRKGLASEWATVNPILALGEMGIETDTKKFKFGDGLSQWSSLDYSTRNIQELEDSYEPKNTNIQDHINSTDNPHQVTKEQVGLGNVSNLAPADLPISSATQTALNTKADVTSVISSLSYKADTADVNSALALKANSSDVASSLSLKADSSSVTSALALKADASSVYTKGQVDSIASNTLSSANSYADNKAASIVNSAPATLDTLNELASALGNDPNFATTTANLIGTKANSSDVNAALALKANSADVSASLELKADSSSVYTKSEVFTKTESNANFEPKNSNIQSHISNVSNPHAVTKAQVGLGSVDNTSDSSKPISVATQSALDLKANSSDVTSSLSLKVDKIVGKGLSTEDFTTTEKAKLAGIAIGATANQADTYLLSRDNHTGTQLASTISDFTTAVQAITIDASKIDGGNVSNLEFSYLDGVTSSIQTQINNKVDKIVGKVLSTEDYTTAEKTKLTGIATGATANSTDAQLRDRTTHTGNESSLPFSEIARPSAPTAGATFYSNGSYGRQMFGEVPKVGRAYPFQPHIGPARYIQLIPQTATNAFTLIGVPALSSVGTVTGRTVATTSHFTWQRRVAYVSAAPAGSAAEIRTANAPYGLGNLAGTGGFHLIARFGISDAAIVSGARSFVGFSATTTALTNADPSTFLNQIGVGHDAADTTLQIMHNGATGTSTKINLGASFPSNTTNTDMYEASFYCAPNTTTVYYYVTNLRTGAEASGTITDTAKMPTTSTLLTYHMWRNNGATAAAVGLDIASLYIETDF